MLRKLKNVSDRAVTVAIHSKPKKEVKGAVHDTYFIKLEPGEEQWVDEYEYKFFLTLEKNEHGYYSPSNKKVLTESFVEVAVDRGGSFVKSGNVSKPGLEVKSDTNGKLYVDDIVVNDAQAEGSYDVVFNNNNLFVKSQKDGEFVVNLVTLPKVNDGEERDAVAGDTIDIVFDYAILK